MSLVVVVARRIMARIQRWRANTETLATMTPQFDSAEKQHLHQNGAEEVPSSLASIAAAVFWVRLLRGKYDGSTPCGGIDMNLGLVAGLGA